jgi:hypothetical protein
MSGKSIIIFILLLLSSPWIQARGWLKIEAEYSTVTYPEGLGKIADSLLHIAELSLPQLAQAVNLPLIRLREKKAKIILTDAPDFANGYVLENTVVVYMLSSEYLTQFSGTESWYKQVLTHELAHLVMFYKVRRKVNWFGTIAYLTIPRWYWEGVAQCLSEPWNMYRGDLYLKHALFDGTFTLHSLYDTSNGPLLYAASHAFVKYLAHQYGASTLAQVLGDNIGGFLYNFDEAFKKTYGASVSELFPQFMQTITLYYGNKYHDYPVNGTIQELPLGNLPIRNMICLSPSDSTFIISVQAHPNHRYLSVYEVKITKDQIVFLKKLFDNCQTDIFANPLKSRIAYARYHVSCEDNLATYGFDWFIYNRQTGNNKKIIQNIHARYAAFDYNQFILNETKADGSVVHRFDPETMHHDTAYTTSMPLGRMCILPPGKIIIEGQAVNGSRDLFLLTEQQLINLTNDEADDRKAVTISDTSFVFTSYRYNHPLLSLYNINRKRSTSFFYDLHDYWPETADTINKHLYLSKYKPYRRKVFVGISLDSVSKDSSIYPLPTPDARYAGWQSNNSLQLPDTSLGIIQPERVRFSQLALTHAFSFALPVYDSRNGWGIFGLSSWFEIMQRQMLLTSFVLYPDKLKNSFFILNHLIKCCDFDFISILYHGPVFFAFEEGRHIILVRRYAGVMAEKPLYISGNPRYLLDPSLGISWQNYQATDAGTSDIPNTSYGILRVGSALQYHKPTRLYPFLAKRQIYAGVYLHKAIASGEPFSIYSADLILGTNFLSESFGIKTNLSWLKKSGTIPPLQILGIDRFYQTNIPRDFGYTKTVRGIREDIAGHEMIWSSNELIYVIPGRTPMKLLYIPLNNLSFTMFYDHAFIRTSLKNHSVFSYGIESTFGDMNFRYGFGYAKGRYSDGSSSDEVYLRFALAIPGLSHMQEDYESRH